nr:alkaline phosphatase D family protein [Acidimicrobiia bacterium]
MGTDGGERGQAVVVSRRTFLALGASVAAGACTTEGDSADTTSRSATTPAQPDPAPDTISPPTTAAATTEPPVTTAPASTEPATTEPPATIALAADPFRLGVTSGDPDTESVVIWTRLLGDGLSPAVPVEWDIAADEGFDTVTATGIVDARAEDGYSVHVTAPVDAASWYRFRAGGFTSPVGRAAPTPRVTGTGRPTELRIATAACQHFETGYYAAHRDLTEWAPDLVLFLGDFIYENASRPVFGDVVRSHAGAEPTDVAAYRARYAQYLTDPDLQTARAACPWLVIWDDHEVENNYAGLTPQDPADAALFAARRDAAYRAWWEHMPVRLPPPSAGVPFEINRAVRWGGLAEVALLDGRQFRSPQVCGAPVLSLEPPCPEAADPARTMLGPDQEAWLGATLAESTATWSVLGQQTVMTDLRLNGAILNYDQWDGYAPARERLLLQAGAADRLVVLTGDIHLAGVGLLPGVGVEFVTASVSSTGNVDASLQPVLASYDNVVDAELAHRGYVRHTVTAETWTAEYRIVDDVTQPGSTVSTWRTFAVD